MTRRTLIRLLPAVLVTALFVLTLFAPSRGAGKPGAQVDSYYYPNCTYVLESGGSDSTFSVAPGFGITQPLGPVGNIATAILDLVAPASYFYGFAYCDMVQWDPVALAPDPTTVALRTSTFPLSELLYNNHLRTDYYTPIVNRFVPGLADPPTSHLALDFSLENLPIDPSQLNFARNGSDALPSLLQYAAGGARSPAPGAHPVASHTICGGDDALQQLYLVQSVMTATAPLDTSTDAVMQRFRVRVATSLKWVEVALQLGGAGSTGLIEVYDGEGTGSAPPPLLHPLASAPMDPTPAYWRPTWVTHADFATAPTLQPDHDYWLYCESGHAWQLRTRMLTGKESPYFQQNIGPFYRTTTTNPDWQPLSDRTLSFRVVGLPLNAVQVSLPARSSAGPRLSVTPNPARGAALVRWSGAAGTLWLDVFDARGRRVARAEGANGGAGEWRFSGLDEHGRALPAGVYFVRGTDDAGRVASQRLVLIR